MIFALFIAIFFLIMILVLFILIPLILIFLVPFILMFIIPLILLLILLLPFLMIFSILPGSYFSTDSSNSMKDLFLIFLVIVPIVKVLYFSFMESSKRGASIGKILLGIKVTDTDGRRISFLRALARNFSRVLSIVGFLINLMINKFTKRNQFFHDLIAKTVVVKKKRPQSMQKALAVGSIQANLPNGGIEYGNTDSQITIPVYEKKKSKRKKKWILFVIVGFVSVLLGLGIVKDALEPHVPVPVDLSTGTWYCGEDIEPGEYVATPIDAADDGTLYINEESYSLGDNFYSEPGVTVVIEEGDSIDVNGTDAIHFEPVVEGETPPVPVDLAVGTWTCGVDIVPGEYTVTQTSDTLCNFVIKDKNGVVKENVALGASYDGFIYTSSIDIVIYEGDTIEISDGAVHFEPYVEGVDEAKAEEPQPLAPVDLGTGTWTCGVDIAPGAYTLTTASGIASVTISGSGVDITTIDDLDTRLFDYFDSSATYTLEEGDTIEIDADSAVHFEPSSETSTPGAVDLGTGTWTCGVDIEPGQYTITTVDGSANVTISGAKYDTAYIDSYNTHFFDYGDSSSTVTLSEGDTIEIDTTSTVHFEPVQ